MTAPHDTRPLLPLDAHIGVHVPHRSSHDGPTGGTHVSSPTARSAAKRSRRPAGTTYTGTAVAINRRIENRRRLPTAQVATFRLERYDAHGDRLRPISVEMRGVTITGGISDGERVRVSGRMRGGVLAASQVYSLTTGATMSTRALSLLQLRLGRRGAFAVIAVVVLLAAGVVRFIPQVYYNTPFGKIEYRADVTGTCERIAAIRAEPLMPPARFSDKYTLDPDSGVFYRRDSVLLVVRTRHDTVDQQYSILLARITPIALSSRRNVVKSLVQQEKQLFHRQEAQVAAMPATVSLEQIETVSNRTLPQQTELNARLGAAMTALAGRNCAV